MKFSSETPSATHQMEQSMAALSAAMPMAAAVLRGCDDLGSTSAEAHRILVAFFDSLLGKGARAE